MKWLLAPTPQRWNRRWSRWGHLFGGRYKAQMIDERTPEYLRSACDYVHLNPDRARLLAAEERLEAYRWSSYPAYLRQAARPPWLRTDRLLGEHGKGSAHHHLRLFAQVMEDRRGDGLSAPDVKPFSTHWRLGAEDFAAWLAAKLGRRGAASERAQERRETDEQLARRLIGEGLQKARLESCDLAALPKGHPAKVSLARLLRRQTPMTRAWMAKHLHMGSASYVSALLSVDSKN